MATLFNNTEITNAFFNGTELDKIYFNGVLVFEKQQLYFRRVIVGDIFEKGKKMKSDFYSGFYNDFSALPEYNDNVLYSLFTFAPGVMSGIEATPADTFEIDNNYLVNSDDILIYSYNTKTGEEFYNNGPYAIVVNSITNTSIPTDTYSIAPKAVLYRHFYIEDENIRPLKVGDILDTDTKFYFTFPDDYDVENNQVDTLIKLDNDNNKRISITGIGGSSSGHTIYFRTSAAFPGVTGDNSAIFFIGSTFINKSSIVVNDIKTLTGKTGYFNGTVTYIDATHSAYQHILVDTTTLGV